MKNLVKILSVSLLSIAGAACSNLEENPTTSLTETSVFDNEAALESNLRGVLRAFQGDAMYTGNMNEQLNSASALIHWASTARLGDERWDCLLKLTESSMVLNTNMYADHYTAINRANKLLEGLTTSPVDQAYKTEIAAETKFYRAVLYFGLVRCYGSVPLSISSTTSDADLAKPREPYFNVYAQIVKDLKEAFDGMRDEARVKEVTGTQGRPNKWAAKAFLAAVYLQIGSILEVPEDDNFYDLSKGEETRRPNFSALGINSAEDAWNLALSTADDVIQNGPYKLAAKYSDLFTWDYNFTSSDGYGSWDSPERIFVIQSTGEDRNNYCAMRSLPQYPEGSQVKTPASRYGNWRPTRFFFQKWCETYPGDMGPAGSNNSDIYVNTPDPRLNIALINTSFVKCNDGNVQFVYPHNNFINSNSLSGCYPFFKKYLHPSYDGTPGVADFYFMRFAEVYYIAAEAAARLGSDEAYDYIEVVHRRARFSTPDGSEASQPQWTKGDYDKEELVNAIIWDKLFELCGEGHEFFETHRNGATWLSTQIAVPANVELSRSTNLKIVQGFYNKAATAAGDFQYPTDPQELRRSLLCTFPLEEISYNPALGPEDQNDFIW